jgi:FkbM family methyltransferase
MIKWVYNKLPENIKNILFSRINASNRWFDSGIGIKLNNANKSAILKRVYFNGYGGYESETQQLVSHIVNEYSNFIDIGANVGFYSYLISSLKKDINIFSIDPVPVNCEYIKKIISVNNILNIKVFEMALSSTNKSIEFFIPISDLKYTDIASKINRFKGSGGVFERKKAKKIEVQSKTLNNFYLEEGIISKTLIKLDVEEAELEVLSKGDSALKDNETDFIVEYLINSKDNAKVFSKFKEYGYSSYLITSGGLVREDRPLTMPNSYNGTLWMNHFVTKRMASEVEVISRSAYGRFI